MQQEQWNCICFVREQSTEMNGATSVMHLGLSSEMIKFIDLRLTTLPTRTVRLALGHPEGRTSVSISIDKPAKILPFALGI